MDGAPRPMLSKNSAFLLILANRIFSYSDRSLSLDIAGTITEKFCRRAQLDK
jgi:hypothetical protein